MRKFASIAWATAIEILDDPLSLLVLLSSAALLVLAPTLHYHQFGEVTRMKFLIDSEIPIFSADDCTLFDSLCD